jgi:hypothetical protein
MPRAGSSLLAGLVVCGRCGYRMVVTYAPYLRYTCSRARSDYAEPTCQGLSGGSVDAFVAEQVLKVLQPASLELSLTAEADLHSQRQQLEEHWKQRRERAAFEVDRAARQYAVVEPENRLVARELERRWEASLEQKRAVEEEYHRFQREQPEELSATQREAILHLSEDVPAIWHAPTTTVQDRQEIVRLLLNQVVVNVEGTSERVDVALHWAGGFVSRHHLFRPVPCYEQLSNYLELREQVESLRKKGESNAKIVDHLNGQGFRPPKGASQFNANMVSRLLCAWGLQGRRPRAMSDPGLLGEHEHWLADLALKLGVRLCTLRRWQCRGWVQGRKVAVASGRWALWADVDELSRLRRLRNYRPQCPNRRYPAALTTPKLCTKIA